MLNTVASWATIAGTALAVLAILIGLGVGTVRWQRRYLSRLRWKFLGPVAVRLRPELTRRQFRRAVRTHLDRRLLQGGANALSELHWLTALVGATETDAVETYSRELVLPFTFRLRGRSVETQGEELRKLAQAYREYATAIRRRWMLRTAAAPIVAEEHGTALHIADRIDLFARCEPIPLPAERIRDLQIAVADAPDGGDQWVRLRAWPDGGRNRHFAGIRVSPAPYRVVTDPLSIAFRTCPPDVTPLTLADAGRDVAAAGNFDGIMTKLVGDPGFRMEIDPHSGRQVLHVCLGETSFFAFRLTQWRAHDPVGARPEHAFQSRLLSMNLFLVDDEDKVLLTERAAGTTHEKLFAGAASGAIEPVAREGIEADVDGDGIAAPLKTVIREAREELGIDISRPEHKLGVVGLIEVMSPRDMHTHVVTATARIGVSADSFTADPGLADDIEGSWEVGNEAMVIDLRAALANRPALREFVSWLRSAPELLPHGVGGLLLLARVRLPAASDGVSTRPTADDLYEAVVAPLPPGPAQQPSFVHRRPFVNARS